MTPHATAADAATDALSHFTHQIPYPVMRLGPDGSLLYINKAGAERLRRLGGEREQALPLELLETVRHVLQTREATLVHPTGSGAAVCWRIYPDEGAGSVTVYGHPDREPVRAEQLLQDNEAHLNAILESAADGILLVSDDGVVEAVNPAAERIFGRDAGEMRIQFLATLLSTADGADIMSVIQESSRRQDSQLLQAIALRDNGTCSDVECSVSAVTRRGQNAYTIVLRDVSERKRLEYERQILNEQMMQTARQAGQFEVASGVLHNVGNVLNSIATSVSALAEQAAVSESTRLVLALEAVDQHWDDLSHYVQQDARGQHLRPYLQLAAKKISKERLAASDELQGLAKNLEHVKRIIAAQQAYARRVGVISSVVLSEVADDALRIAGAMRAMGSIGIVRAYSINEPVRTDKHVLLQLLINLVLNALDALSAAEAPNRRLLIAIDRAGDHVRIRVDDNGIGIAADNLPRLFAYGFTTKPGGHGFGLHSAAIAARQLDGNLTVESPGLGQGAIFALTMPLSPALEETRT